ncbi:hypothetical protein Taro_018518, partial [Colocasia esculenta]|nr:hypothetical protein [Colocasia esculenta]
SLRREGTVLQYCSTSAFFWSPLPPHVSSIRMGDKDGCCSRAGEGVNAAAAAPFVMKTYWMVEDPETDALIAWESGNNSFVVVDPFGFAERLLPAHFKHANFSSFVRQLNTYGFRKVDPDRWEFAHESFLRGQTHLLRRIVRRHGSGSRRGKWPDGGGGGEVDDGVAVEVARLKWEQRAAEEVMQSMWRRLEETERRPRQMLAFLFKVVQNPHLLPRLKQRPLAAAATPSTAPEVDGRQMCTPDDDLRTLSGWQQETCSGQHPQEEELLEEAGSLPLARDDEGVPVLPSSDAIEVFLAHSQLSPEFVSGGRTGIDEEAAACSAATTYPFVLPTK